MENSQSFSHLPYNHREQLRQNIYNNIQKSNATEYKTTKKANDDEDEESMEKCDANKPEIKKSAEKKATTKTDQIQKALEDLEIIE